MAELADRIALLIEGKDVSVSAAHHQEQVRVFRHSVDFNAEDLGFGDVGGCEGEQIAVFEGVKIKDTVVASCGQQALAVVQAACVPFMRLNNST